MHGEIRKIEEKFAHVKKIFSSGDKVPLGIVKIVCTCRNWHSVSILKIIMYTVVRDFVLNYNNHLKQM